MIRIKRLDPPKQLNECFKTSKTELFKKNKREQVWNENFIKYTLLEMTNDKCCYCECKLGVESKYMEVDHFYCKDKYLEKVLEWTNLLPSCKRCNISKGTHDVAEEPIIDPTDIDPKNHLYIDNYRYRAKDQLGKSTIGVLHLNDSVKSVKPRFDIGEKVNQTVSILHELVDDFDIRNTRRKNKLVNGIKGLLREACPESIYSATVSYVLLGNDEYVECKYVLVDNGLWDNELEILEKMSRKIYMSKC